jgi:CheY-like chemotaxis protein
MGDPVRLNQILLNLINNAIKFTEKGGIYVEVKVANRDAEQVEVDFSVRDTGIGIPENKLDEIFFSFTQVNSDATRRYGGAGLGLAICKQLVSLQNGSITVQSKEGSGSIFSFRIAYRLAAQAVLPPSELPVKNTVAAPVRPIPVVQASASDDNGQTQLPKKGRILLVEDNEFNQTLVVTLLNKWNYYVEIAANGRIAIEKLREGHYDAILMDVQMPELDGYQTTEFIRKEFSGLKRNIPIIAMTASALKGDLEKCIAAGMDDFISKPFDKKILYDKLLLWINSR